MTTTPVKPWIKMEGVPLLPDVTSEKFSEGGWRAHICVGVP